MRAAPLHGHPNVDYFYVISGEVLALRKGAHGYHSIACKAGDYIRVPSGTPHEWLNVSSEPFVTLIVTTPTLGKFFLEAGMALEQAPQPPTSDDFSRLAGYWDAASEENTATGMRL